MKDPKPGDRFAFTAVVAAIDGASCDIMIEPPLHEFDRWTIPTAYLENATPLPPIIEVGDMVTVTGSGKKAKPGLVLMVDQGRAFVRWGNKCHSIADLDKLTITTKGPRKC